MSWLGWLILGPYLAGCLLAWRWIAYAVAADTAWIDLGADDVIFGMFVATFSAGFWPLIAVYLLVRRSLRGRGPALIGPAPWTEAARERQVEAGARAAALEQQQRIERLEQELGIGEER